MISKKELEDILFYENKSLSRNNLYQIYLYLNSIKELRENFKLEKNIVWNPYKIKKNSIFLKEYFIKLPIPSEQLGLLFIKDKEDFWTITNLIDLINIKEIKNKYLNKDKYTLEHYVNILLNHMIPINNKYIEIYIEKINKKIQQKKNKNNSDNKGGIYGIYENDKLVYIGLTMRDFQKRWKEHKENIINKSNKLIFYKLINPKSKIEFKKILELDKMKSNKKITRRDLEAMEFALIQLYKPKYNFSGNTQPYIFSD